jgi:hypothetical protein
MAASAVSKLIEPPSVDRLVGLHIVDLCTIADHYGLFVPEEALKAELLVLVREGLVRLFLLLKDEEREASGEKTGRPSNAKSEDGKEEGVDRTPFTLSQFNPLFSASGRSDGTTRLKVRLAAWKWSKKIKSMLDTRMEWSGVELNLGKWK